MFQTTYSKSASYFRTLIDILYFHLPVGYFTVLSGSFVIMVWCVLRMQMEQKASEMAAVDILNKVLWTFDNG
jgi:hypothetical protein